MAEGEQQSKSHGCIVGVLIVLIIAGVLSLIIFLVVIPALQNNGVVESTVNTDGAGKLFSRSANNGDIEFNISDDFSFSIDMQITPTTDIKGLQMTFVFLDKNDNELTTRNYTLGNVTKGVKYSVTYRLSEFSLSQMFKIAAVRVRVTGGTVSYFA